MQLGTWQAIYLAEFDGPRTRSVDLTVLPGRARDGRGIREFARHHSAASGPVLRASLLRRTRCRCYASVLGCRAGAGRLLSETGTGRTLTGTEGLVRDENLTCGIARYGSRRSSRRRFYGRLGSGDCA